MRSHKAAPLVILTLRAIFLGRRQHITAGATVTVDQRGGCALPSGGARDGPHKSLLQAQILSVLIRRVMRWRDAIDVTGGDLDLVLLRAEDVGGAIRDLRDRCPGKG